MIYTYMIVDMSVCFLDNYIYIYIATYIIHIQIHIDTVFVNLKLHDNPYSIA